MGALDDALTQIGGQVGSPSTAVAVVRPDRLSADPGLERLVRERGYGLTHDTPGSRV